MTYSGHGHLGEFGDLSKEKEGRDKHESLVFDDHTSHWEETLGETIRRLWQVILALWQRTFRYDAWRVWARDAYCGMFSQMAMPSAEGLKQSSVLEHILPRGENSQWRNQDFIPMADLTTKGNTLRYSTVLQALTCQWYKLDGTAAARDHLSSLRLLRCEIFWHHISSTSNVPRLF